MDPKNLREAQAAYAEWKRLDAIQLFLATSDLVERGSVNVDVRLGVGAPERNIERVKMSRRLVGDAIRQQMDEIMSELVGLGIERWHLYPTYPATLDAEGEPAPAPVPVPENVA